MGSGAGSLVAGSGLLLAALLCGIGAGSASAAIFDRAVIRSADSASGYTLIRVCIDFHSSAAQAKPDNEHLVHDDNPPLSVLIGQVRDALRRTWEAEDVAAFRRLGRLLS